MECIRRKSNPMLSQNLHQVKKILSCVTLLKSFTKCNSNSTLSMYIYIYIYRLIDITVIIVVIYSIQHCRQH